MHFPLRGFDKGGIFMFPHNLPNPSSYISRVKLHTYGKIGALKGKNEALDRLPKQIG